MRPRSVGADEAAEAVRLRQPCQRAGRRVVYEETAVAWTEVPGSLRQLWRQRYRWCFGTIQAMWKHRREMGPAGRFGRRGLGCLALFQIALPLIAPVVDVFGLDGALFVDPVQAAWVWSGFLVLPLVTAGYALRLDGERLRALWALPLQVLVYRQPMYLVVIQSVDAFLLGARLKWQRAQRSGTAAQAIGQRVVRVRTGTAPWGGPRLLVRTVERNTGLRMDNYAEIRQGAPVTVGGGKT